MSCVYPWSRTLRGQIQVTALYESEEQACSDFMMFSRAKMGKKSRFFVVYLKPTVALLHPSSVSPCGYGHLVYFIHFPPIQWSYRHIHLGTTSPILRLSILLLPCHSSSSILTILIPSICLTFPPIQRLLGLLNARFMTFFGCVLSTA